MSVEDMLLRPEGRSRGPRATDVVLESAYDHFILGRMGTSPPLGARATKLNLGIPAEHEDMTVSRQQCELRRIDGSSNLLLVSLGASGVGLLRSSGDRQVLVRGSQEFIEAGDSIILNSYKNNISLKDLLVFKLVEAPAPKAPPLTLASKLSLPSEGHWWCRHPERALQVLELPFRAREVEVMSQQLQRCAACIFNYHLYRDHSGAAMDEPWTQWDVTRLVAACRSAEIVLSQALWQHTLAGEGLVNAMLEILSFPSLLDDLELRSTFCSALSAVNAVAESDHDGFEGVLPWDQGYKLAGVYSLMGYPKVPEDIRAWAIASVDQLGLVGVSDYEDVGIGDILRGWVAQVSNSLSCDASSSSFAWSALATSIAQLDTDALEALFGHCPGILDIALRKIAPESRAIDALAAAKVLSTYVEAFGQRVWYMAPVMFKPWLLLSGLQWHLENDAIEPEAMDAQYGHEVMIKLIASVMESLLDSNWEVNDTQLRVYNSLGLEDFLDCGHITLASLGTSRDIRSDLKTAVDRCFLELAIYACAIYADRARGVASNIRPDVNRIYHTSIQTICNFLGKFHYETPPMLSDDEASSKVEKKSLVPTSGDAGSKKRWETDSDQNVLNTSSFIQYKSTTWWPTKNAILWSDILTRVLCESKEAPENEECRDIEQATQEAVDETIRIILAWHSILVQKLSCTSSSRTLASLNYENFVCHPLIRTLYCECRPFSLPVCVHAYIFCSEMRMAHLDPTKSQSFAPQRTRFLTYLHRLIEACRISPHNAAGRLIVVEDQSESASTGARFKAVLQSIVSMSLISGESDGSQGTAGLSVGHVPLCEILNKLLLVEADQRFGRAVEENATFLKPLFDVIAEGAGADVSGKRTNIIVEAILDAIQMRDQLTRTAPLTGSLESIAFSCRIINLLLSLARHQVRLILLLDSSPSHSKGLWYFFSNLLGNHDLLAAEPVLVLKGFKTYFQDFLETSRELIFGSLKQWASNLLPYIEWVPPQNICASPKDIKNVRKWSGAILANAVISAQQSGRLDASATVLKNGCHRLIQRVEPPLDPQLKSVLSAVLEDMSVGAASLSPGKRTQPDSQLQSSPIATLWKRKQATADNTITISDSPPPILSSSSSQMRRPFALPENSTESALDALMAAEEEDAVLQSSSGASSNRLGRIKKRPAAIYMSAPSLPSSTSTSSSSSSSVAMSKHQMDTHGEGDLIKLKPDSSLLSKTGTCHCAACGDIAEESEWLIVRTKNLSRPYIRHLQCVAPPVPSLLDVKEFIRKNAATSESQTAENTKRSLNSTDLYVRQTQLLIDEAIRLLVELVRPGASASATQLEVTVTDALAVLERIKSEGVARVMQSARRRKVEKLRVAMRPPSANTAPIKAPLDSLQSLPGQRSSCSGRSDSTVGECLGEMSAAGALRRRISGGRGGASQAAQKMAALQRSFSSDHSHSSLGDSSSSNYRAKGAKSSELLADIFQRVNDDTDRDALLARPRKIPIGTSLVDAAMKPRNRTPPLPSGANNTSAGPVDVAPVDVALPKKGLQSIVADRASAVKAFQNMAVAFSLPSANLEAFHCAILSWTPFHLRLLQQQGQGGGGEGGGQRRHFSTLPHAVVHSAASCAVMPARFPNAEFYSHAFEPLLLEEIRSAVAESIVAADHNLPFSKQGPPSRVPELDAHLTNVQRLDNGSFSLEMRASSTRDPFSQQQQHLPRSGYNTNGRGPSVQLLAGQVVRPSDLVLLCPLPDDKSPVEAARDDRRGDANRTDSTAWTEMVGLVLEEDDISDTVLESQRSAMQHANYKGASSSMPSMFTRKSTVRVKVFPGDHRLALGAALNNAADASDHLFVPQRWRVVRLESLATASREYGALKNMHHLTTLGAALLHASPNPPPSKPSHQHQHSDASCCVQEDALVSLSMRLMRESAAADLATDDEVHSDERDLNCRAQEAAVRDRAPPSKGGELRGSATATSTTAMATQAAAVAVNGDQATAAKEPSALLRVRVDALNRTVCLCEGLLVNEQLLRTEAGQTVITQLRALKKYWHAPVRDAAKSALANWKDQVATISSASSAGIATASAFRAPHNGHGTDVSSAVRSGIPTRPPSLEPRLWSEICKQYNAPQLHAIAAACRICAPAMLSAHTNIVPPPSKEDGPVMLLQGPPGTGKTRTVLGILSALLAAPPDSSTNESGNSNSNNSRSGGIGRILVCAPSNGAVNEIVLRLKRDGLLCPGGDHITQAKVLRIGSGDSTNCNTSSGSGGSATNNNVSGVGEAGWEAQVEASLRSSPALASLQVAEEAVLSARAELDGLDHSLAQARQAQSNHQKHSSSSSSISSSSSSSSLSSSSTFNYGSAVTPRCSDHSSSSSTGAETDASSACAPPLLLELLQQRRVAAAHCRTALAARAHANKGVEAERRTARAKVLRSAMVVLATLSGCGSGVFEDAVAQARIKFKVVLIDEAAQAVEPSCLIPLRFGAERLMLVGDPRQLPATVRSRTAAEFGLERSLFERLEEANYPVHRLTVQYRMHPEIRSFPSARFYEGALADGPGTAMRRSNLVKNTSSSSSTSSTLATVSIAVAPHEWVSAVPTSTRSTTINTSTALNADATPSISRTAAATSLCCFVDLPPHPLFPPLLMLDLGNQSREERQGTSYCNRNEATVVADLAMHLLCSLRQLPVKQAGCLSSKAAARGATGAITAPATLPPAPRAAAGTVPLAILTPYKSQVRLIQEALAKAGEKWNARENGTGSSSRISDRFGRDDSNASGGAVTRKRRHRDWNCSSCSAHNFANRYFCFQCSTQKPSPSDLATAAVAAGGGASAAWWATAEVSTVDGFQGREAEVVVFCCVRTAPNGRIGFLADLRRQNVALTRAKHSLIVVGCKQSLEQQSDWAALVNHLDACDRILACGPSLSDDEDIVANVERICPPLTPQHPLPKSDASQANSTRAGEATSLSTEWDYDPYFGAISYRALSESLARSEGCHNSSSSSSDFSNKRIDVSSGGSSHSSNNYGKGIHSLRHLDSSHARGRISPPLHSPSTGPSRPPFTSHSVASVPASRFAKLKPSDHYTLSKGAAAAVNAGEGAGASSASNNNKGTRNDLDAPPPKRARQATISSTTSAATVMNRAFRATAPAKESFTSVEASADGDVYSSNQRSAVNASTAATPGALSSIPKKKRPRTPPLPSDGH